MIDRNDRLEAISDKIRCGIPVGISEAIAAIDYQEARRAPLNLWARFRAWLRAAASATNGEAR